MVYPSAAIRCVEEDEKLIGNRHKNAAKRRPRSKVLQIELLPIFPTSWPSSSLSFYDLSIRSKRIFHPRRSAKLKLQSMSSMWIRKYSLVSSSAFSILFFFFVDSGNINLKFIREPISLVFLLLLLRFALETANWIEILEEYKRPVLLKLFRQPKNPPKKTCCLNENPLNILALRFPGPEPFLPPFLYFWRHRLECKKCESCASVFCSRSGPVPRIFLLNYRNLISLFFLPEFCLLFVLDVCVCFLLLFPTNKHQPGITEFPYFLWTRKKTVKKRGPTLDS